LLGLLGSPSCLKGVPVEVYNTMKEQIRSGAEDKKDEDFWILVKTESEREFNAKVKKE